MGWVKLDDNYRNHPKIVKAGADGMALDIAGMCYSAAYLTDGFVPDSAVTTLYPVKSAKRVADRLVTVGRWERDDDHNGYWIHDYLDYNPPADKVLADREKEREKKRNRRRNPDGTYAGIPKGVPGGQNGGHPHGLPEGVPSIPSRPVPSVVNPSSDLHQLAPESETPMDDLELERLTRSWQNVLHAKGSDPPLEAVREAVRESRRKADVNVVAERIGYIGESSYKPRSAGYLVQTVENYLRDHGAAS